MCCRPGVILCASPAQFVSQDFLLYLFHITHCATPHMLLAHPVIPAKALAETKKLKLDGKRPSVVLGSSSQLIFFFFFRVDHLSGEYSVTSSS